MKLGDGRPELPLTDTSNHPQHILTLSALGNCAEMEEGLTPQETQEYERQLAHLIYLGDKDEYWANKGKDVRMCCFHASSLIRVIAYLRVKSPEMFVE